MSSYSEFKSDAQGFASRFPFYVLLPYVFLFFPACIISLQISRWFYGIPPEWDGDSLAGYYMTWIALSVFGAFLLISLFKAEQYFIVLMAYIITLWPFLYMLWHYCIIADSVLVSEFPLPINWIPFL